MENQVTHNHKMQTIPDTDKDPSYSEKTPIVVDHCHGPLPHFPFTTLNLSSTRYFAQNFLMFGKKKKNS